MRKTWSYQNKLRIKISRLLAGLLLALPAAAHAERLPLKQYTTADGLACDYINRIVRDSRGYLWFCTSEGLSRFDGHEFITYTLKEGLPHRSVLDLLETRDGTYWVATGDGLCRFVPTGLAAAPGDAPSAATRKFEVYRPDGGDKWARSFRRLLEDRAGNVWCGTAGGLFRLRADQGHWRLEPFDLGLPPETKELVTVRALLEDRQGNLWVGTAVGLFRRRPDGRVERYTERHGLKELKDLTELVQDRAGRLWLATRWGGLHRLVAEPDPDRPIVAYRYQVKGAPFPYTFLSLFEASDGRLWAGRHRELVEIIPADDDLRRTTFRRYTAAHGLAGMDIWALGEDGDGNLWLGSETGGVMKIVRHRFALYTEADGLPTGFGIIDVPNQTGEPHVSVGNLLEQNTFARFDGGKFIPFRARWPGRAYWWGFTSALQDHAGGWWIPTSIGLLRFPAAAAFERLARAAPRALYTARDGLSSNYVFGLYEDTRGDLWIAHGDRPPGGLTRWVRATGTLHSYSRASDAPFLEDNFISTIGEDASGQVWLGLWHGGVARQRAGRFQVFTAGDGAPAGMITHIYRDRAGRLWIASSSGGVARVEDSAADRPRFVAYTRASGLASDSVNSITEDRWGRIYLATARGINRIDMETGRIKHYTTADGLPENTVNSTFRDRHDMLWFATRKGLVRLDPEPDRPAAPPTVLIRGLRIAGEAWPVSDLGQQEVTGITEPAHRNQFQINFVGIHSASGETLRYEYKLEGAGQDWQSTDQRTIHYASLAPGAYRFLVRAITSDGLASTAPAAVTFTILRPVWQSGWFLTLSALAIGLVGYGFYRYRLAQAVKLERVRVRIATDLHDDIGASLSGMALISDVIKRQTADLQPKLIEMVDALGESARRLVGEMSDIVWSIDPRRDALSDLVARVRQLAAELLDAKGVAWNLEAPPELDRVKLTPEQRRHVFLIFKEALNNIARHAGSRQVTLALRVEHRQLWAEVRDDGRGMAEPAPPDPDEPRGSGLRNMQARAAELRGRLDIDSAPGRGTRLTLQIPLKG